MATTNETAGKRGHAVRWLDSLQLHEHEDKVRNIVGKRRNMKSQTNMTFATRSSLALALALAIWSPVQARSAEPAEGKNMTEAKMMERCQEMKEQKQKMMEDMKAQDAQLTEQLTKMNRAPKNKKMGLMAAVITHMVEQRITMDARKAKMEEEMMKHMMQHMQMGKDSMSQCPMMKGMKDMGDKPASAHEKHHEEQK